MKLNKTLLSLGTLAAIAAPIATVVSCGGKAPTTPTNTNPTKGNTGNQDPSNTGNPSTATVPVSLKEGILDFRINKIESNENLNKVFEQFSTSIDFAGDQFHGLIAQANRIKMNDKRHLEKVLIVANPTSNNGSVVFYAGVIGYDKDSGDSSTQLYFTFKDFKVASNVKDVSPHGSEKQINLSASVQPDLDIDFILTKGVTPINIVNAVKDYAKSIPEFKGATFSQKN